MFSFYGGKRRLARFYPPPQHDVVVEPFAGSASYSVTYLVPVKGVRTIERAILIEKDPPPSEAAVTSGAAGYRPRKGSERRAFRAERVARR